MLISRKWSLSISFIEVGAIFTGNIILKIFLLEIFFMIYLFLEGSFSYLKEILFKMIFQMLQ